MDSDIQARTGWYTTVGYDMIREMIKVKYIHVRDNNEPAPDSLCYDSMQTIEDSVEKEREAAALARGEVSLGACECLRGKTADVSGCRDGVIDEDEPFGRVRSRAGAIP
jgi:hypothetical protein